MTGFLSEQNHHHVLWSHSDFGVTSVSDTGPPELHELTSNDLSKFLDEDLESNSNANAFCDLDSILDDLDEVADTHLLLTNPEKLLNNGNGLGGDGLQLVAMSPNGLTTGLSANSPSSMCPSLMAPNSSSTSSSPSNGNGTLISSTIDFGCDITTGPNGLFGSGPVSNGISNSTRTSPTSFDDLPGITTIGSSGDSSNDCVSPTPSTTPSTIIHHNHMNISSNQQQQQQQQQQQHISILAGNGGSNQKNSLLRGQPQPQIVLHHTNSGSSTNGFVPMHANNGGPNSPSIGMRTNPNLPHPPPPQSAPQQQQQQQQQHRQLQSRGNASQSSRQSAASTSPNGSLQSKSSQLHALRAQTATPTPQPDSTTPTPSSCTSQKPQSGSILQNALLAGHPNQQQRAQQTQQQQQQLPGSDQSLLSQPQASRQGPGNGGTGNNGKQVQSQQSHHLHHRSLFNGNQHNFVNSKSDSSLS
ncbi:PREDICTED: myb-like protein Q, partial [Rhagoletis zephyria]|uniref:myb-like protein Q n=1 Tax=Rhagoletis zephyria TaxID=28612 RepID=UPI0008119A13